MWWGVHAHGGGGRRCGCEGGGVDAHVVNVNTVVFVGGCGVAFVEVRVEFRWV